MEAQRPVLPERPPSITIEAWRCEHCRKFYPLTLAATAIVVDDVGTGTSLVAGIASRGRIAKRMIVCPTCVRSITGRAA